jgi:integrase/recombinase XerD
MTDKAISPLRQRLIDDMTIRRLSPKTKQHYIRHVKNFADFVGRSPDKATAEDVRRYQLRLATIGTTVPTVNISATALRFFFKVTLKRTDLAAEVVSAREPRRPPVVLSPEEVGRLLASSANIKHKAALSLAYATGLRASEVISLKLTDIDSDRMIIRVEEGKGKKDRYVMLSPNLLELLREWWRAARKKGWMHQGQRWLFPGYRGQHMSARSSTGSFAWQRHVAALSSVSVFIRCGTVLPPIFWSKRPIFASSRFCSDTKSSTRRRCTRASPSRRSAR